MSLKRETKLMHYGRPAKPGPANPPVVRASTILHETVNSYKSTKIRRENDDNVLSYGRRGTTTAHALSAAIADLECAENCWLFPTGVGAISSTFMALLRPSDHILVVDSVFPATRTLCENVLKDFGITTDYFPWDATDLSAWTKPETKLIFVESPGSQTFEIIDLPKLTKWAHKRDILVVADNTYGSGWLYQPIKLGCDVSIIAGTKYLGGHADVMMGATCASGNVAQTLRRASHLTGQTLAPDEAYNTLRGMRTLPLRLERHESNAWTIAQWLLKRPEILEVIHPKFPIHPGHSIWKRDATGTNGLLTIVFQPNFNSVKFMDALDLFSIGSSWGGFESLAMPVEPFTSRLDSKIQNRGEMVRLHAGLEHIDDLIHDLKQALESL